MTSTEISDVITFPTTDNQRVVDKLRKDGYFMAKYETLEGCRRKLFEASKEIFDHLAKTNSGKSDFDIPEATTEEGIKKFIPSMRPERRKDILAYTRTATELEEMVRKIVFGHNKLPKTGYRFQMMKEEVRLDFLDLEDREEFLAVLDLNQVNGLEMSTTDGKCFSINVRPSTFLIMAGKPFKDWSKGKILQGNGKINAVGLFSYCKKDN